MRQLMNKKELCEATNGKLTMWSIGELTRRGVIPVIRIPGMRIFLYDFEAVNEWMDTLQDTGPNNSECKRLKLAK